MVHQTNQSNVCNTNTSTFGLHSYGMLPQFPVTLLGFPVDMPLSSTRDVSTGSQEPRNRAAALAAILEEALAIVDDIEDETWFQDK